MFKIDPTIINNKQFYLKESYSVDETFDYTLTLNNNISKTGLTINLTDVNPWVSGTTNISDLQINDKVVFNSGFSYNINNFSNLTHIFNNMIQISGVNYTFYSKTGITYTSSIYVNNYIITFNDDGGKIVVVDPNGSILFNDVFCSNPVKYINVCSLGGSLVVGYYDTLLGLSFLKKIEINSTLIQSDPQLFYFGECKNLKINSISENIISLTYHNNTNKGVVQIVEIGFDDIFSIGYPFTFNNSTTLYSTSAYLNNNIAVLYYDISNQLCIKNIMIYNQFNLGIGLPTIIKTDYCSDLNIGVLNDYYVYLVYYNITERIIENNILKIENNTITKGSVQSVDDWQEGVSLKTINDSQYIFSYMDQNFNGVYRLNDFIKNDFEKTYCDYNEFNIDLRNYDVSKLYGHNNYTIKYNNVIIETGVMYIEADRINYNI